MTSNIKKIVFWAPKGGVGKSTRCLEMAFALTHLGKKVVIMEFDSQKDISKRLFRRKDVQNRENIKIVDPSAAEKVEGVDLSYPDFKDFYDRSAPQSHSPNNIYDALAPIINPDLSGPIYTPKLIDVLRPSDTINRGCLQLLPGHANIQEYDTQVTIAYASSTGAVLRCFDELCKKIILKYQPDYILVDLDPSRGRGNGHIICSCDGLIIPCEADGPSCDAVKDAIDWTIKFKQAYDKLAAWRKLQRPTQQGRDSPREMGMDGQVKVLGTMQSNFTYQEGINEKYVIAEYSFWMRKIDTVMVDNLPKLQEAGLAFSTAEYEAAGVHLKALCVSRTPSWFSLNSFMDKLGIPVAYLRLIDVSDDPDLKKKFYGKTGAVKKHEKILEDARARVVRLLGGAAQAEGVRPPMESPLKRLAVPAAQQTKRQKTAQQEEAGPSGN